MKRLLNIDRPGGFPLCAETLAALDENSMMLVSLLGEIPLGRRQAMMFGRYMLVCDATLRTRVVETGAITAASLERCRLEFRTGSHSVHDSSGNEIADVWRSETADIVDETSPGQQWEVFSVDSVFETGLWRDYLGTFEAGLSGAGVTHGSVTSLTLHGQDNLLRGNRSRVQMRLALQCAARVTQSSVLTVPVPCSCDAVRIETDLEYNGGHYPARSYLDNGSLRINIGRWLEDESIPLTHLVFTETEFVIRINREVLL